MHLLFTFIFEFSIRIEGTILLYIIKKINKFYNNVAPLCCVIFTYEDKTPSYPPRDYARGEHLMNIKYTIKCVINVVLYILKNNYFFSFSLTYF